jgi:hypothetical protein
MSEGAALEFQRQFSLAYLLAEVALVAVALAAGRMAFSATVGWMETQAMLYCISLIATCGALGGLCLRMAVGLVAGGVFAVASIPLLWLLLSSTS